MRRILNETPRKQSKAIEIGERSYVEDKIPERQLIAYLLYEGITLAARGDEEELFWVFKDNRQHYGSFRFCCYILELDPDWTRELLAKHWTRESFRKFCASGRHRMWLAKKV